MSKPWLSWVLWGFQVVVFGYFVSLIALNFLLLFLSSLWRRRYKQKSFVHPIDLEALASLGPLVGRVAGRAPARTAKGRGEIATLQNNRTLNVKYFFGLLRNSVRNSFKDCELSPKLL